MKADCLFPSTTYLFHIKINYIMIIKLRRGFVMNESWESNKAVAFIDKPDFLFEMMMWINCLVNLGGDSGDSITKPWGSSSSLKQHI